MPKGLTNYYNNTYSIHTHSCLAHTQYACVTFAVVCDFGLWFTVSLSWGVGGGNDGLFKFIGHPSLGSRITWVSCGFGSKDMYGDI